MKKQTLLLAALIAIFFARVLTAQTLDQGNFILGTTLALALGLAGCAHQPSNAQIGTGAGAVAGGLLGDAVFGTTFGTIGGAAAGAVIGNEIGKRSDGHSHQKRKKHTKHRHYHYDD